MLPYLPFDFLFSFIPLPTPLVLTMLGLTALTMLVTEILFINTSGSLGLQNDVAVTTLTSTASVGSGWMAFESTICQLQRIWERA